MKIIINIPDKLTKEEYVPALLQSLQTVMERQDEFPIRQCSISLYTFDGNVESNILYTHTKRPPMKGV